VQVATISVMATATQFEHLLVTREGATARITLNRPDRYNALSLELLAELRTALEALGGEPEVQAIVIAGSGRGFSAGHDLAEMIGRADEFYAELFDECTAVMRAVHAVPQPVIARVHGVATAAGCQLVAACDLAVAADSARFGTPGVRIGLFCSTPMVPLSRAIGRKRALEMLLTGELIPAETAHEWGLVNRVVPEDRLDGEVAELAARITEASPRTVALGKQAFYAQAERDEDGAYDLTGPVMARNAGNADAQEGMTAFLEKRPPRWPA
jgi:enoyl-CoA hydratase/carnithine racemase